MASTTKPDHELSEAAFHSKYGFTTGWEEVRQMVWSTMHKHWDDDRVLSVLTTLYESMAAERDSRRDDYVNRIEQ